MRPVRRKVGHKVCVKVCIKYVGCAIMEVLKTEQGTALPFGPYISYTYLPNALLGLFSLKHTVTATQRAFGL